MPLTRPLYHRSRLSLNRWNGNSLAWLLLTVVVAPGCWAQVTTADLVGTAIDASGAAVPGVGIVLKNLGTNAEYSTTTDAVGNYLLRSLPAGHYRLGAEKAGFKSWAVADVALAIGDRLRQDIHLEVGQVDQSVEVKAQSAALQTDSSSVSSLINERAVQDLPLNGRNFVTLVQLAVGANDYTGTSWATGTSPDDRRRSSSVAVNGQVGALNNFLIDGLDNNERFIGSVVVKPSVEALQEMQVQTNTYSAELGRTAGGVVNLITKSGTNAFHGSLFEFFRNEKLDAQNFFARAQDPKPNYKQNQFGGSIGGPIKRNRTFFFGDFESYRVSQGQTYTSTVPTLAMRAGNFAGLNTIFDPLSTRPDPAKPGGYIRNAFPGNVIPESAIDSVGRGIANLYPTPQRATSANNYTQSPPRTQTDNDLDARVDHRISNADNFYARYSFNDTTTYTPGALPVSPNGINPIGSQNTSGTSNQRAQGLQLNDLHIFGPRLAVELKAGFSRMAIYSLPPNYGINASEKLGIRGVNVDLDSSGLVGIAPSGYAGMGEPSYVPEITINNLFQTAGSLMYSYGAHSIKTGAEFRRRQVAAFQSDQARGSFSFDANFTNDPSGAVSNSGNSIASLLLGFPSATSRTKYLVHPGYRYIEGAAYVQDDWRVRRWLTLNLGLRYEYFSPESEAYNRISNIDLAQGKIVLAGQNGISNTAGVRKDFLNLAPRVGFAATLSPKTVVRGGYGTNFVPTIAGTWLGFRNPPFSSLYTVTATPITPLNRISDGLPVPTPTDPANPRGTIYGVAYDLATPYVMQYNLTVQRELPLNLVGSAGYVGALSRKQTFAGPPNVNQAPPGPGAVDPRRTYYSMFPGLAAINLLQGYGDTSYQALQVTLERRFQSGFGTLATYTWAHAMDNFQYRSTTSGYETVRGNTGGDIRHRFTLTLNYALPFAKTAKGVSGAMAKGWRLNAIAVMQTGLPFSVSNAAARANTGSGDRPNLVGDPNLPSSQRTLSRWFNTAAFAQQPLYQYGNLGRNTLFGPGKVNFDVSAHKEFTPSERVRVEFRAEAFNVANTPAFGNPGSALGSTSFGVISSAGQPRNIQLALKLLF